MKSTVTIYHRHAAPIIDVIKMWMKSTQIITTSDEKMKSTVTICHRRAALVIDVM